MTIKELKPVLKGKVIVWLNDHRPTAKWVKTYSSADRFRKDETIDNLIVKEIIPMYQGAKYYNRIMAEGKLNES